MLWHETVIGELVRRGVTYFVVSPGSRSGPLAIAIARHPHARSVIAYDERAGAYHAVGYARATATPAVLICTSGTAAANYLPAIAEASNDALPLIAITADRPPELHDIGANQTMDQQRLYGEFVRHFVNLPPQDDSLSSSLPVDAVNASVDRCLGPVPGPVHINCMLREPFEYAAPPHEIGDVRTVQRNIHDIPLDDDAVDRVAAIAAKAASPVLVAGHLGQPGEQDAVEALAQHVGWPVWADIRSGLHGVPSFVSDRCELAQRLTLSDSVDGAVPDFVLHVGGNFVSKQLHLFLQDRFRGTYVKVPGVARDVDPTRRCDCSLAGDIAAVSDALLARFDAASIETPDGEALAGMKAALEAESRGDCPVSEAAVGYILSTSLDPAMGLVIGNSMPIRFCDRFAIGDRLPRRVAANRGVSGIDGTMATAIGFGMGLGERVLCVLGDISFIHDLNALTQIGCLDAPLTVVVVNNGGGGIFHHLPVAHQTDAFDEFFTTPHAYTFEAAARQFALDYACVKTNAEFREHLQAALTRDRHTLIELSVDQAANMAVYRRVAGSIGR